MILCFCSVFVYFYCAFCRRCPFSIAVAVSLNNMNLLSLEKNLHKLSWILFSPSFILGFMWQNFPELLAVRAEGNTHFRFLRPAGNQLPAAAPQKKL